MVKRRVILIVSHPIQHFCPQYASFASNRDVVFKVLFGSTIGMEKYFDPNFGKEVSWGSLYLDQFDHEFLNGDKAIPSDANMDSDNMEKSLDQFSPDLV